MSTRLPVFARAGATVLTVAVFTLAGGAAAQAHVRVIPESTAGGSFTKLTFRVPNESDTASTTSLAITLPTDTPLVFVSAQQMDGWTVKITKSKLPKPVEVEGTTLTEAPSAVTWTAVKGNEVGPGEFQEFALSGGPLPTTVKTLSFPVVQTYSDGTVAKWDQVQAEGAEEPEYPLPSFALTAALPEGADADAAPVAAPAAPPAAPAAATTSAADEVDGLARVTGIGGLVVGLLGLAFGLLAWRRTGTSASPAGAGASESAGSTASADRKAESKTGSQA